MKDNHKTNISALSQIPIGIWFIGITTTLMTISSLMIFSLTPLFLKNILGASIQDIGILEGIVEAVSQITRIFSGVISDYFGKRRGLIVFGYALMTIVKPIFALAPGFGWIIFAKFTERLGNGLQAAPREALIGDLAPVHLRGTCFGLRNSLTKFGSVTGALLVWWLMYATDKDYKFILWIALIPAIIGMIILIIFVQDKEKTSTKIERHPIHFRDIGRLGLAFWSVMGVVTIFMLSHCSESFLSLRAENLGLEEHHVPMIMFVMNAIIVFTSYYAGALSDRMGRKIFLMIGFASHVCALLILSFAPSWEWVILGVVLWGVQMGTTQGALITIVVDTTPKDLHGTAFGIFFLIIGISSFFASYITGTIWNFYSPFYAFGICAMIGTISLTMLPFIHLPKIEEKES